MWVASGQTGIWSVVPRLAWIILEAILAHLQTQAEPTGGSLETKPGAALRADMCPGMVHLVLPWEPCTLLAMGRHHAGCFAHLIPSSRPPREVGMFGLIIQLRSQQRGEVPCPRSHTHKRHICLALPPHSFCDTRQMRPRIQGKLLGLPPGK